MNEQDVELLESYLDDELTGRALEALRLRLSTEPQLAAGIDELRACQRRRQQFFAACQPDEASVNRLIQSVRRETTRDVVWGERNRKLRWASGLAACLAFGFIAGRALHTNTPVAPTLAENSGSTIARNVQFTRPVQSDVIPNRDVEVASNDRLRFDGPPVISRPNDNGGSIDFSIRNPRMPVNVGQIDPFPGDRIYIYDGGGRLVQQFDSHEQYMKFVTEKLAAATQPASIAP